MTKLEAKSVVEILLQADGGCPFCVRELLVLFGAKFPSYQATASDAFKLRFPGKDDLAF